MAASPSSLDTTREGRVWSIRTERAGWHADWPYNQKRAGHIPAPYPDATAYVLTLWMLSPFTAETGGTLIVPASHRSLNNPMGNNGVEPAAPYPTEMQALGEAGSVLMLDGRRWHSTAPNYTAQPRDAVRVTFARVWLNLAVLTPGTVDRRLLDWDTGHTVPPVPRGVYERLPSDVQPLSSTGSETSQPSRAGDRGFRAWCCHSRCPARPSGPSTSSPSRRGLSSRFRSVPRCGLPNWAARGGPWARP